MADDDRRRLQALLDDRPSDAVYCWGAPLREEARRGICSCLDTVPFLRNIRYLLWCGGFEYLRGCVSPEPRIPPLRHVASATRLLPRGGPDSIFQREMLNRVPQTDVWPELCSFVGAIEIQPSYQCVASTIGVPASVICATHGQKRSEPSRFATVLYCLCKCLG